MPVLNLSDAHVANLQALYVHSTTSTARMIEIHMELIAIRDARSTERRAHIVEALQYRRNAQAFESQLRVELANGASYTNALLAARRAMEIQSQQYINSGLGVRETL